MSQTELKPTLSVTAQVAALPTLPMPQLRGLWRKLFETDAPTHVRAFLERRIAYRLQEVEFRKTNQKLLESNQRRIDDLVEATNPNKPVRDNQPPAGTVLTREYREVEHHVTVLADGQYDYQGRLYPSLSMIAREITGTRWSGPAFFGLKSATKPKGARKGGKR
ncbi:conserved hypothetical protein [Hahella chejuensis KCTC 2396]|uniref:Bacteriophage related protein n=1 Tax=Hahella chejuensis (strain KCTC 2396) TaxID=349521 RepID=Q2SAP2_HAHCH|nr:DUF2924 domain-containing protein [Hahella chejuensis]ABC32282.1 conserved hypothetical protein [Hahella chejuensis KCTC 2396]